MIIEKRGITDNTSIILWNAINKNFQAWETTDVIKRSKQLSV